MSGNTSFNVELAGALEVASQLSAIPSRILLAQKRALATVRRRMIPQAKRDIYAEYNVKAKTIGQGLRIRDVPDGIKLIGKGTGINRINFGATWSPRFRGGARWRTYRGGGIENNGSAFIAVSSKGMRLAFARRAGAGKISQHSGRYANTGIKREPLTGMFGPSVATMLRSGRRPERLAEFAIRILAAEQRRLLASK